jgi:type IV pilus assembly protein PilV
MALMEALISILIFSFGVLGLIGLEARAINFSVDSEDRNRAALFASEIASNMWLTASVTPTAATLSAWQTSVADPTKTGLPNGTVSIIAVAGTTNAADIKITWQPPSDGTTITAATRSVLTTRVILP